MAARGSDPGAKAGGARRNGRKRGPAGVIDAAAEDLAALEAVRSGSEWLRSVACTLARRGAAFRLENPARARMLLDALGPSPLYKAGQFLFDLLEWEDFMLDAPPPAVLPTTLDPRSAARLATLLRAAKSHLDGSAEPSPSEPSPADRRSADPTASTASPDDENLPPLEGGFYLYDDVVLGILRSYAANRAASARREQAAGKGE